MKPIPPKIYSKKSFIKSKVKLSNELCQIKIGPYQLYPLLVGYLDNLFLGQLDLSLKRQKSIRLCLGVLKNAILSKRISVNTEVLIISTNANDSRYKQLINPIVTNFSEANIRSVHHGGFEILRGGDLFVLVKTLYIFIRSIPDLRRAIQKIQIQYTEMARLKAYLLTIIFSQLYYALSSLRSMKRSNFQFLLVDWDHGGNQALSILNAKLINVPSATLVHGHIAVPTKFVPLIADYCYTWGGLQNRFFEDYGIVPKRLKKVGFTSLKLPSPEDSREIKKVIPKRPKHWIGYAEQRVRSLDNVAIAKEFNDCIQLLGEDWGLMIRPHPSQNYDLLVDIFEQYSNFWVVPKKFNANEVLSMSSLFLVVDSTFSLDCIFYNTPLVFFNPENRGLYGIVSDFVRNANARVVTSGRELGELLSEIAVDQIPKLLFTEEMHHYAQKYIDAIDEISGSRIKDEIILTIENKGR